MDKTAKRMFKLEANRLFINVNNMLYNMNMFLTYIILVRFVEAKRTSNL